tara:strand:+ start:1577 stop:2503 length:927 start_codon:yes stop_codon:yes gene_type:complete
MYPSPKTIIGDKKTLLDSYNKQVSELETMSFSKKNSEHFRFCSYNVKAFDFNGYGSNEIKKFIEIIQPDAFSLIEYEKENDKNFRYNKVNTSVLFEQLPDYGIFTNYNSKFMDAYKNNIDNTPIKYSHSLITLKKFRCLTHDGAGPLKEFRGFTHLSINHKSKNINIITVHLDVYDEAGKIRLLEIKEIYQYILDNSLTNTIIIGDFNEWDLKKDDPTYKDSLIDFKQRTNIEHFSTKVHDYLKGHNFSNVFHMKGLKPLFSCWSGKLVDFCYLYKTTWSERVSVENIYMPIIKYSDHLPVYFDLSIT